MKRRTLLGALMLVLALMLGACSDRPATNPGTSGGSGVVPSGTATGEESGAGGDSEGIGSGSGEDAAGNALDGEGTP